MNRDIEKRDELLFGAYEPTEYQDGTRHFWWLSVEMLNTLIAEGFVDEQQRQNASPTIREFKEFMTKYPEYLAHGYAVGADRTDCRISIEGLEKSKGFSSQQELDDFLAAFRFADDFYAGKSSMYCWYD